MPEQLNDTELTQQLRTGLDDLGLEIATPTIDKFQAYIALLYKWNRSFNLTAVRDPLEMVPSHILDSLTLLPFINGRRCLDVGSGAGLPGMILAICNPEQHWCLLDSNGKKIRFLKQAVMELELINVEIIQSRVEDYIPQQAFSTIVCRAYASLADYLKSISHLIDAQQTILAMKGALAEEELQPFHEMELRHRIQQLKVPGIDAERNLVIIDLD